MEYPNKKSTKNEPVLRQQSDLCKRACAYEHWLMKLKKQNKETNKQTKKLLIHSIPESETYLMDWYVYVNYENYEYNDTKNNNYYNNNNNNINNK